MVANEILYIATIQSLLKHVAWIVAALLIFSGGFSLIRPFPNYNRTRLETFIGAVVIIAGLGLLSLALRYSGDSQTVFESSWKIVRADNQALRIIQKVSEGKPATKEEQAILTLWLGNFIQSAAASDAILAERKTPAAAPELKSTKPK